MSYVAGIQSPGSAPPMELSWHQKTELFNDGVRPQFTACDTILILCGRTPLLEKAQRTLL